MLQHPAFYPGGRGGTEVLRLAQQTLYPLSSPGPHALLSSFSRAGHSDPYCDRIIQDAETRGLLQI